MTAPKVFISYSHDSAEHKDWVLRLATDLRANGIDVSLDQWDLAPGQDIAAFMSNSISVSDRVVLICSATYVRKAEEGRGGVGYERLIITSELIAAIDTRKFLPLVRANISERRLPNFLGARLFVDFNSDEVYRTKLDEILRDLHGTPALTKPPLGPNPFSGSPPTERSSRVVGTSGLTKAGVQILDDSWFLTQRETSKAGLSALGLSGSMEVQFSLHDPTSKSQIELLNGVLKSQIHTFGWPLAVTLEGQEPYGPKPVEDGIVAEVSIPHRALSAGPSYDFWRLRNNGDFFLLQDLFEDQRSTGKLFFDTRIVRVTEAFLFCSNLYESLGVASDSRVGIRITHRGLKGRELVAVSPNRHVFPVTTTANSSQVEVVDAIRELRPRLVDHVMQVTEPMFMLFNFKKFERKVYDDLVNSFAAGRIS